MRIHHTLALTFTAALLSATSMAGAAGRLDVGGTAVVTSASAALAAATAPGQDLLRAHGADDAAGDDHGKNRGNDNDKHRGGHGSLTAPRHSLEARGGADDAAKGHGGKGGHDDGGKHG